jgi:hypothetical protein
LLAILLFLTAHLAKLHNLSTNLIQVIFKNTTDFATSEDYDESSNCAWQITDDNTLGGLAENGVDQMDGEESGAGSGATPL